jgi:small subunit ribosomal protein S6
MAQLRSQRDAPGTQREYETIYILKADASTESVQEVNTRIRKVIEDGKGKVLRVDNWGKRKLAYEIKKQLKGIYLHWLYLGETDLVAELERNLRMLDLVVRFNTVKVDEDVNPEVRPSMMDEESFLAAAAIPPDEEDSYLGRGFADDEEGEGGRAGDDEDIVPGAAAAAAAAAAATGEEAAEPAKETQAEPAAAEPAAEPAAAEPAAEQEEEK